MASWFVDAAVHGAQLDCRGVNDAAVAGGSLTTVTSATAAFTANDTGRTYTLATSTGTITVGTLTYVNSTTATMSTAAGGAITGGRLIFGTDDTAAWQDALNAALPGQVVDAMPLSYRSLIAGNLNVPEGVQFILDGPRSHRPDTNVAMNTWGPTLVFVQNANPAVMLQQGSGFGSPIMFGANQVPPTANTPIAYGAFLEIDEDTLPWASRQTRVMGCSIGSPFMVNPWIGMYIRGGQHVIDSPQIGGLGRSVIFDHMWDFVSVQRIEVDRYACVENPGLGANGLNVYYLTNPTAVTIYRADGLHIHELAVWAHYRGIEMDDSPAGAQDPSNLACGYGMIGMAALDGVAYGIFVKSTNTPGLIVGQAQIGPNPLGYGTAGQYGIRTAAGGGTAPLVVVGSMSVRGAWAGAATSQAAGSLIVPATNPG